MFEVIAIVAIVERGKADYIVNRAKKVGAQGATIFYGRVQEKVKSRSFLICILRPQKRLS